MNNKRNVVIIGNYDINSIFDLKNYREDNKYNRFPNILYIDNPNQIERKKGFLLISDIEEFKELDKELYDNEEYGYKVDIYEFDRLNRKKFKNFEYVIIFSTSNYKRLDSLKLDYSNIIIINDNNCDRNMIYDLYDKSLNKKYKKISDIKMNNINKLKEYLRGKTYIKTKDIMDYFNVSDKWVKRYMKDMNDIYNNIGYNYVKKCWYKVK